MAELGWSEGEVWRMTPHKILTLFRIHRQFHPERYRQEADIDEILGGL